MTSQLDFYYDWEGIVEILIADQKKKIYNLRLFTS